MIKIFYDLETTGVNPKLHSIHQISGVIEIDNVIVDQFNIKCAPNPKCHYDDAAMAKGRVTQETVEAYMPMKNAFKLFTSIVKKHVNPFDKRQKAWLSGFRNSCFDDIFLRAWFEQNGDTYFGSLFYSDSLDIVPLAAQYLGERRKDMPSFKLHRVAKTLGIVVNDDDLHDALYDALLTRQIYRIVTGLDLEI